MIESRDTACAPAAQPQSAGTTRILASLPRAGRLESLDALRGFDMFWLLGGQQIVAALAIGAAEDSWLTALRRQFTHVEWAGFRFYDFIFPLFLFLIGTAIPYSIAARRARGDGEGKIFGHALLRFAGMVFFGWWIHGNLLSWDWRKMQLSYSVLMMLGFGYVIAVALVLWTSRRTQVLATIGILAGYWALQMFVPVPGHVPGEFVKGAILSDWLYDHSFGLLGKPWSSPYGRGFLLTLFPHAATAMLGVFAAYLVRSPLPERRKVQWMLLLGGACLVAGWLWSMHFPIVKNRWTSTYVLWSGGWSFLLLALFYWVIDVKRIRGWSALFVAIGSNSLLAYLLASVFAAPFRSLSGVLFGGLKPLVGDYPFGIIAAVSTYGFAWLLLIYLHRRRIFLRL
jgi:predicted acyltransferase